mmetsp:Transcript_10318/g.19794  ORF Transcript_10318/g.19794 Transcript_10318/m.19794 type:complete len:141 (-) Transcript_10318:1359-1781(-)
MRRKHFYKRTKEPVDFSWTLFLIAALQVSVWSFGVWEHPFHQFLVTFQQGVRGERPNSHLSWDKPLPSLTQQLVELLVLRDALHSPALRKSTQEGPLSKRPSKLDFTVNSRNSQQQQFVALLASEEDSEDPDGKAGTYYN